MHKRIILPRNNTSLKVIMSTHNSISMVPKIKTVQLRNPKALPVSKSTPAKSKRNQTPRSENS